jgi:hypothetical protein
MPPILVLIIVGLLLAFIGYLSLQLYISRRILEAFQRAAVVVPPASEQGSGLKSGLVVLGLILTLGIFASLVIR